jgi:hypothetical protein
MNEQVSARLGVRMQYAPARFRQREGGKEEQAVGRDCEERNRIR